MVSAIFQVLWVSLTILASTCYWYFEEIMAKFTKIGRTDAAVQTQKIPVVRVGGLLPLPAQNLILRNLSPLDRFRYSLANREANYAVSSFHRQVYRAEHILSPYFTSDEINFFRLIQRKTDTLISGSSALQFFDLSVFPDSDLDLYVVKLWDRVMLLAGFLASIGYEFNPRPDQLGTFQEAFERGRSNNNQPLPAAVAAGNSQYSGRSIWDVYSFVRDGKKIQIITCEENMLQVILAFHSTCVMNVISYTHAYALYPYATFIERQSVAIPRRGRIGAAEMTSVRRAFGKYTMRGWNIVQTPSTTNALRSQSEFRDTARCVGDSACWVIALNPVQPTVLLHEHAVSRLPDIPLRSVQPTIFLQDDNKGPAVDPVRANSWYSILSEEGQTSMGFEVLPLPNVNEEAHCLAQVPRYLKLGSASPDRPSEDKIASHPSDIEHLVRLTHESFDVKPTAIREHVRKLLLQARAAMPILMSLDDKEMVPSTYSMILLLRHLDVIFNSFREDPTCKISFRVDQNGGLWTRVDVGLPPSYPLRSVSALRIHTDDVVLKHLARHRVWITFQNDPSQGDNIYMD